MKKLVGSRAGRGSLRTKVLAIAFVPSVVFLLTGVAVAGYLVADAIKVRTFATKIHEAAEPAGYFFAAVREERRLTLQEVAKPGVVRNDLLIQHKKTDAAAATMARELEGLVGDAPANVQRSIVAVQQQMAQLPGFRQRVDAGQVSLQETYDFYNRIIDQFTVGLNGVAQETPTAETAYLRLVAMPLFTSADGMSRGDALAAAGMSGGGLTEQEFRTYIGQVGAYHATLASAVPDMIPSVRQQYEELINSPAWERLSVVENAFLRGNHSELPVPDAEWREAARVVGGTLWKLYVEQSTSATQVALDEADSTLVTSIIAGAAVIALAVGVLLIAWRLSNRLVRRLTELRKDTLHTAEEQMPKLVERVRAGEDVDLDTEISLLDHGDDEIGQVADAFNKAQQTAIAAAVEEAKTREGTKRVFLNIAHRSQVIVHRQLQALDSAERKQEDPDQLDMLFRLDHLSTRARRNAENLIILGGEQPGRQWRNPVALSDVVRGATAETEDYQRVTVTGMPAVAVAGPVVGDLVHLLAELIDNATSFSPPQSRVEVRGHIVGRGVVVEVEDRGLGIEPEPLEQLNDLLRTPPDFSFMALSDEPRLGLFVVARLAEKHGITVTLRESAYGGTRAIVLLRTDLLSALSDPDDEPLAIEAAVPRQQGPVLPAPAQSASGQHSEAPPSPTSHGPTPLPRRSRPRPHPAPDGERSPGETQVNSTIRQIRPPRPGRHAQIDPAHSGSDHNGHALDAPATSADGDGTAPATPESRGRHGTLDNGEAGTGHVAEPEGRRARRGDALPGNGMGRGPAGPHGRHGSPDAGESGAAHEVPQPGGWFTPTGSESVQTSGELEYTAQHNETSGMDTMSSASNADTVIHPAVPAVPTDDSRAAPDARTPERPQHAIAPQPGGGMAPDRPPLPRRRRQQNLAPQLRDAAPETEKPAGAADTPEQARSRLAAFQRGTQRARAQSGSGHDDQPGD